MERQSHWAILFICWVLAAIATTGSLFFSEVMEFPPCVLCWYQRIAMYPLVVLFLVGVLYEDRGVLKYSFPLVIIGWLIALYHNLLYYGIIPESASPCLEGVSCSTVFINWFGFMTIPMLSIVAFTLIFIFLVIFYRRTKS